MLMLALLRLVFDVALATSTSGLLYYGLSTAHLLLLGAADTHTSFHIDPAAAITYAFAVGAYNAGLRLAVWLFFSPRLFQDAGLLCDLLDALREVWGDAHMDTWKGLTRCASSVSEGSGSVLDVRRASVLAVLRRKGELTTQQIDALVK
jgi:hypothetical protein